MSIASLRQHSSDLVDAVNQKWVKNFGGTLSCAVCLEEKSFTEFFEFTGCAHLFCNECVTIHVKTLVKDFTTSTLTCPSPVCQTPLASFDLVRLISPAELQAFENRSVGKALAQIGGFFQCQTADCTNGALVDDEGILRFDCRSCNTSWCVKCKQRWHKGSCKDSSRILCWKEAGEEAAPRSGSTQKSFQHLKKLVETGAVQPCPYCGTPTLRSGGCDHIRCPTCGRGWMWKEDAQASSLEGTQAEMWMGNKPRSRDEWLRVFRIVALVLMPLVIILRALWPHDRCSTVTVVGIMLHTMCEAIMRGGTKTSWFSTHWIANFFFLVSFFVFDLLKWILLSLPILGTLLQYLLLPTLDNWVRRPAMATLILGLGAGHLFPELRSLFCRCRSGNAA